MLKTVEIVIILAIGGSKNLKMKQQVLKALANPARIFYVPYSLAVINFAIQFIIFIVVFMVSLLLYGIEIGDLPLYFMISVCVVHMVLAFYSKREPQLGQIISAKIQLLKHRIPRKLAA